jgi:hypothetical protein
VRATLPRGLSTKNAAIALALVGAAIFALIAMAGGAHGAGCTKTWKGGSSGSWATASNWTPEAVPTSSDDVCITASGTYTVTLSENTSIASLALGGGAGGTQTLEVQPAFGLTTSGEDQIEASGSLTLAGQIANSTTRLRLGSGALANAGLITLGGAAPDTSSAEIVGNVTSTGTIEVLANTSYSGGTLDDEGPLKIANAMTLEDDNATVIDDTGGKIEAAGTGRVLTTLDSGLYNQGNGTTSGSQPVVVDSGFLEYTGTGQSTVLVKTGVSLKGSLAEGQALTVLGSSSISASAGFTNAGTITIDGTGGNPSLHVTGGTLTNSGTITTQASGVSPGKPEIVGNLTNTGTINNNTSSVYNGSGHTLDNEGPLRIANATTFEDDGATVVDDTGGAIEATGSGELDVTSDSGVYDQGNGTTSGAKPVVIQSDAFEYTGTGASTVLVSGSGPSLKGNLAADQSLTVLGSSSIRPSASFTNAGAITLDATGGNPSLDLSAGTLTNSGTITTQAGASPGEPEIVGNLTNTGTINIDTNSSHGGFAPATLDNEGHLQIANGATFNDVHTVINDSGGSIEATGSGDLETTSDNGVYDQGEGTTSGSQPVVLDGAALDYTGKGQSSIVVVGNLAIQGSLSVGQSLTVRGNVGVTAPESFTNAGTITLDGAGGDPSVRLSAGTLTNSGTLTTEASGGSPGEPFVTGALTNTGTIDVAANSSFEGLLTNAKTLTVATGERAKASSFTQTAGTTTLAGSSSSTTLEVSTAKLEGGLLEGVGTIKGNLLNGGRVAPGATTPGAISVTGSYVQQASGELAIDVAEGGADTLSVATTATLAGTLALATTGFTPTTGHTYTPLTDASQSGEFQTVSGLSSGPYEIKYNPANVELVVLSSELPTISIGDVTMRNPDSGDGTAKFTVTLSKASSTPVSVHYATTDGIARAPGDYEAAEGTLTFTPGKTAATIAVTVHGTSEPTADRTFYVHLSNPTAATISQAQGTATVQNDHIALTSITPAKGGQGGTVTITLVGAGFSGTPTVTLLRAGQPDIVATDVTPDPTGEAMTATFDLSTAVVGAYEVIASLPEFDVSAALPEAFTVGEAEAANITDELIGFPTVSTNEPWTGELVYTNTGTVDAHNAILEIEGFQSGAQIEVSGPNVTGSVVQDDGNSRTVQIDVSLIPAGATNTAFVTFTPVGDNGSLYSLQDQTVVSSDENFTPTPVEPSASATNQFTSQTETSVQGVVHVTSNTGAGDLHYSIESEEVPASAGLSPPTVSETTLPNGEIQEELQATLPPPAQGPPIYGPGLLLFPGEFETCTVEGGCEVVDGGIGVADPARTLGPVADVASPELTLGMVAGHGRAAARARPSGLGQTLQKVVATIKSGQGVQQKIAALKNANTQINAAKHANNRHKEVTDCLMEKGYLGQGEAETANNLSSAAEVDTAFEQLSELTNLGKAVNGVTSPKALALFNSIVQSGWGTRLFGSEGAFLGIGSIPGSLVEHGRGLGPSSPYSESESPQQRLQKAYEECPPKPPPPPKPKPKPRPKPHPRKRLKVRNSHDPNELVGPEGYGSGNFVAAGEPLTYEALFTNEASAGASVRKVSVTDQLDPGKIDLSTFSFGPVYFGSTIAAPPPGLQSWKDVVDLRPAKDLLVEINASLNTQTGLVTWTLQAIDPETGLEPVDPEDGFLPPDSSPPNGVGGASFTVLPKAGLPTGEAITDSATIVFDRNAPIATADWIDTIDASTPSSQIEAVTPGAGGVCGDLAVSWSGTDTGAGIDHYDIYVSQNGGPFDIWKPFTAASSAIYVGLAGDSYRFSTVATDGVEHSQAVPGTPSASVVAGCPPGPKGPPTSKAASSGVSISHLTFSPAAFAVGKGATALAARAKTKKRSAPPPTGTTIGYVVSAPGAVAIAIERKLVGLKVKGQRCVAATAAGRKRFLRAAEHTLGHRLPAAARGRKLAALLRAGRCTALQLLGTLTRTARAGANDVAFSGRLGSRPLAVGSYFARASVTPATTPPSSAGASFEIVPAAAKNSRKG